MESLKYSEWYMVGISTLAVRPLEPSGLSSVGCTSFKTFLKQDKMLQGTTGGDPP